MLENLFGGSTTGLAGKDREQAEAFLNVITKAPDAKLRDIATLAERFGFTVRFEVRVKAKAGDE